MGLSADDKMPIGITPKEAYRKIREWYVANKHLALAMGNEYGAKSAEFISNLPKTDEVTDIEMKAILYEVILGQLEWAYHKGDGQFKMAAYAFTALETLNLNKK